jgi:hypothetical protein
MIVKPNTIPGIFKLASPNKLILTGQVELANSDIAKEHVEYSLIMVSGAKRRKDHSLRKANDLKHFIQCKDIYESVLFYRRREKTDLINLAPFLLN